MKTTKEVLQILGISRNTLKKRMADLNVSPHIDDKGKWVFSEDDIKVLNGETSPEKSTNMTEGETSYDKLHDALDYLREQGMTVSCNVTPEKRGYKFEMTQKTRKQRELIYNAYIEYPEARYNKRKQILDTLDKEFPRD